MAADVHAARIATTAQQATTANAEIARVQRRLGTNEAPTRVLTVMHDGRGIAIQDTGRGTFEKTPDSGDVFSDSNGDLVILLRDNQSNITQVLYHDPIQGARQRRVLPRPRAKAIEAEAARQIAEVPDRFREARRPCPAAKGGAARPRRHAGRRPEL